VKSQSAPAHIRCQATTPSSPLPAGSIAVFCSIYHLEKYAIHGAVEEFKSVHRRCAFSRLNIGKFDVFIACICGAVVNLCLIDIAVAAVLL